ncbi:MAG: hypothetical protein OXE75_00045, partial [bacterium]|nr:hypothetical protein [bacterium]
MGATGASAWSCGRSEEGPLGRDSPAGEEAVGATGVSPWSCGRSEEGRLGRDSPVGEEVVGAAGVSPWSCGRSEEGRPRPDSPVGEEAVGAAGVSPWSCGRSEEGPPRPDSPARDVLAMADVSRRSDLRPAADSAPPGPPAGGVGSEKRVGSVIGGSPTERIAVGFGSAGPTSRLGKPDPHR